MELVGHFFMFQPVNLPTKTRTVIQPKFSANSTQSSKVEENDTPFKVSTCKEDMEHVRVIRELKTDGSRDDKNLTNEFYKWLTKPVQSACKKVLRVGKIIEILL